MPIPFQQCKKHGFVRHRTVYVCLQCEQESKEYCQLPTTQVKSSADATAEQILAIAERLLNNVRNTGSPKVIAEVSRECGLQLQKLLLTYPVVCNM